MSSPSAGGHDDARATAAARPLGSLDAAQPSPETDSSDSDSASDAEDAADPEPLDDPEPVDPDLDIDLGRWAFLSRYFSTWFQSTQYGDRAASTSVDLVFDSFFVFLPFAVESTDAAATRKSLRRLRDATELSALMLQLDASAWWYLKKTPKPWFRAFFPSNYDPERLVPKMTFVLHKRFGDGDDSRAAAERLRYLLVDCGHTGQRVQRSRRVRAFLQTKRRIQDECDPERRLRSFRIPIAVQLRPAEAATPDQITAYLGEVVALVQAVQRTSGQAAAYPFRLDEIHLGIHLEHVSDAVRELRELFSLGVPVTMRLRHPHTHISLPFAWTDFGFRSNLFPVVAENPAVRLAPSTASTRAIHTLVSRDIHNSVELLSAVAFSSSLRTLEIEPDDSRRPKRILSHAKWLAFALRQVRGLETLVLRHFEGTPAVLDAMEAIAAAADPARLLDSSSSGGDDTARGIIFKPDTKLQTKRNRAPQTFGELNVSSNWAFPVVDIHAAEDAQVKVIVPGHGICSAPRECVASLCPLEAASLVHAQQELTTLVLDEAFCDPGMVSRLVCLFGKSLQELRWADGLEGGFDDDLASVLAVCPELARLYLQGSSLRSLAPLCMRMEASATNLRTLSLMYTPIPMDALVSFFDSLGDETSRIARSLESFSYYCPGHSLDEAAAEAALEMLDSNGHLANVSLGIYSRIYDAFEARFQAERHVEVQVERLPRASKLALCSVVQLRHEQSPASAVGRLDRSCLALVFKWFARSASRRVRVIQSS